MKWIHEYDAFWIIPVGLVIGLVGLGFWFNAGLTPDQADIQISIVIATATAEVALFAVASTLHARKQAQAATEVFNEMKQQRYAMLQPWVFPDLFKGDNDIKGKPLEIVNIGKGPAIDVAAYRADGFLEQDITRLREGWIRFGNISVSALKDGGRWPFIKEDDQKSWLLAFDGATDQGKGAFLIVFHDIYNREFLTGWLYHFFKSGNNMLVRPQMPIYPILRSKERTKLASGKSSG